jgi:hypothetical protein
MVRRWRLIGYFPILYNPLALGDVYRCSRWRPRASARCSGDCRGAKKQPTTYGDEKVANREIRGLARRDRKGSLNDGQIQNPSKSFGIVPLSSFVLRGFGFVHHSIAILYPNLSLTIRNFFHRSTTPPRRPATGAALSSPRATWTSCSASSWR